MFDSRLQRKRRHVVAVSWDPERAIVLLASVRGTEIEILNALVVPLEAGSTAQQVGEQVAMELEQRRFKNYQLLLGLPRSLVDMLPLQLPPATDAELPDLVRNEVMRLMSDVPEDAIVDFRVGQGKATEVRQVEAAVLRPDQMAQVRSFCQAVGRPAAQLVLRPLAIASLFTRLAGAAHPRSLLVNLMDSDADMSLFDQGEANFSRTVRLPQADPGRPDFGRLADEIRRTIAVAPRDAGDESEVEHIYMFGDRTHDSEVIGHLAEELELPVSLLDPLVGLRVADVSSLQHSQRFAPLIGIIRDYAEHAAPIDFANPKQPPPTPRYGRRIAIYATAATVALGLIGFRFKSQLDTLREEQAARVSQLNQDQQLLKRLRSRTVTVDAVQQWRAGEVRWLDELRDLSSRFPPADQAVVQRMTLAPAPGGMGVISMSVRVSQPSIIAQLESGLRDPDHQISSKRVSQAGPQQAFPCQFETTVLIRPRPREESPPAAAAPLASRAP